MPHQAKLSRFVESNHQALETIINQTTLTVNRECANHVVDVKENSDHLTVRRGGFWNTVLDGRG